MLARARRRARQPRPSRRCATRRSSAALAAVRRAARRSKTHAARLRAERSRRCARGRSAPLGSIRSRWQHAGLRAAAAVLRGRRARACCGAQRAVRTGRRHRAIARSRRCGTCPPSGKLDSLRLTDGTPRGARAGQHARRGRGFGGSIRDGDASRARRTSTSCTTSASRSSCARRHATMRDVGTSFTVRSDGDGGTRVAVTEGAVRRGCRAGRRGAAVVLHAGDRAVVAERTECASSEAVAVERRSDAGRAACSCSATRRWRGARRTAALVRPRARRDRLDRSPARRLTATFDGGTADEWVRVLAAALGGSVRASGDTLRDRLRAPAR